MYSMKWVVFANYSLLVLLFGSLFITIYQLATVLNFKPVLWKPYARAHRFLLLGQIVRILGRGNPRVRREYTQLLHSCGFGWAGEVYLAIKRLVFICTAVLSILCVLFGTTIGFPIFNLGFVLSIALFCLLPLDKMILLHLRKRRRNIIRKEIFLLSHHLLYYSDSQINLHSKLTRVLPHITYLRKEVQWLLHEWYEGGDMAIRRFRDRLGTDEGWSFAERPV